MYCDFEPPEFFNETRHKAKKEHVCCECWTKILPGEFYFKSSGKWDGELRSYKQHTWCRAACTHLSDNDVDGCIAFEGMSEAWDNLDDRRHKDFKKLRTYIAKVLWHKRKPERQLPKKVKEVSL